MSIKIIIAINVIKEIIILFIKLIGFSFFLFCCFFLFIFFWKFFLFSTNPLIVLSFFRIASSLFLLFALVKAIVPRYRYDQLMRLGWKIFLPFSLVYLVLTASFLFFFDKLPKVNI